MKLFVRLLVNALAVAITAYLLPNVTIDSFFTAVVVAVVLSIINTFLKPIVGLLTLPINLLTLGIFQVIINGAFIWFASQLIDGFTVVGFLWAVIFSVVLSIVSAVLGMMSK